jgi:phosphopantothenoylcysteine decarboxylase/phosphopantothenate--cysteine ligase
MAAAVADYRPVAADAEDLRQRKIERAAELTLRLEPVPDLLAAVAASARPEQRIIGFALEEAARLEERARAKLLRKRVHAVVANPLATMDAMGVEGQLLLADGTVRRPPGWPKPIGKDEFARWLVREARGLWT